MLLLLLACAGPPTPPSPPAEVRDPRSMIARDAPHGQARIWPLAQGENAFVGRLELEPGATVPAHRDETEEYIVVLEGHGRVTIDGHESPIGPGAAIYMPANALVSFVNGVDRLVALQVFAGPSPATRYDAWAVADAPLSAVARQGPFTVSCGPSECQLSHRGRPFGEVWHYGSPDAVITSLSSLIGVPRDLWLVAAHAGDGCPVVYHALCLVDERPVFTGPFGNCDAPSGVRYTDRTVHLQFPADPDHPTPRLETTVTVDPWTCATHSAP